MIKKLFGVAVVGLAQTLLLTTAAAPVPGQLILYWNAPPRGPGIMVPTGYTVYESNAVSGVFLRAIASTNIQTFTNGGFVFQSLGVTLTNWDLASSHWITVTSTNAVQESPLTNWVLFQVAPEPVAPRAVQLGAITVPVPGVALVSRSVTDWTKADLILVGAGPTGTVTLAWAPHPVEPMRYMKPQEPRPLSPFLLFRK